MGPGQACRSYPAIEGLPTGVNHRRCLSRVAVDRAAALFCAGVRWEAILGLPRAIMTIAPFRQPPYFLMPHVYPCVRDDYVVLFDIANGKYLAMTSRQSRALADLVAGWPRVLSDTRPETVTTRPDLILPPSRARFIEKLFQRGLLTESPDIGKSAAPIQALTPTQSFPIFSLDRSLMPYWEYLPNFLLACARARWLGRQRRFIQIIERIRARRVRCANQALNEELLETVVRAHHHLRPLVYSVQDQCLHDSLVLLEFLSAYRLSATWVFGIHTGPWIPHCWVRSGKYVLNDAPWRVERYSVIAEF
jgi:hypothetical protein